MSPQDRGAQGRRLFIVALVTVGGLAVLVVGGIGGELGREATKRLLAPSVSQPADGAGPASLPGVLVMVAASVNERPPLAVNPNTQLDSATARDTELTYYYTYRGSVADIDPSWPTAIRAGACGAMPLLLQDGATIRYRYFTERGREVGDVSVTSGDCR
jgi:hypothetical protein